MIKRKGNSNKEKCKETIQPIQENKKEALIIGYVKIFEQCSQMYKEIKEMQTVVTSDEDKRLVQEAQVFVRTVGVSTKQALTKITSKDMATLRKRHIKEIRNTDSSEEEQTVFQKVKYWFRNYLFYFTLVIVIYTGYIFVNNQKESVPPQSILGYAPMTVLTKSMHSEIPKDSLIITKMVDMNTIKTGDDITYLLEDNTTITHRVIAIYEDYEGSKKRGFKTQGIDNPMPDKDIVFADNVVGKVIFHSLLVGQIIVFVRENIVFILVLGVLTIWLIHSLKTYFSIRKKGHV